MSGNGTYGRTITASVRYELGRRERNVDRLREGSDTDISEDSMGDKVIVCVLGGSFGYFGGVFERAAQTDPSHRRTSCS